MCPHPCDGFQNTLVDENIMQRKHKYILIPLTNSMKECGWVEKLWYNFCFIVTVGLEMNDCRNRMNNEKTEAFTTNQDSSGHKFFFSILK